MSKKLFVILLCILGLNVSLNYSIKANAAVQDSSIIYSGDWGYVPNSPVKGEATITRYIGKVTDVKIPSTLEGLRVTVVDLDVFDIYTSATSITIPSSVRKMPEQLYNSEKLKSIKVDHNNTVYSSKDGVLFDKKMKQLLCYPINKKENSYVVPSTVTKIDSYAFYCCKNLTSIKVPSSVTSIGAHAFEDCKSLKKVTLSNGIKTIEKQTFYLCKQLETITLPTKLKRINAYAFYSCKKLKSIEIPKSVTVIEEQAFEYCKGLTSITIPSGVKVIDFATFMGCSNLTSIKLHKGLSIIEENAFSDCVKLKSITIPDSVTTIGSYAFVNCEQLKSITIPKSVTSIGRVVFTGCDKLASINVSGKNKKYASKDGVLYNKNFTTLVNYPIGKKNASFSIPSTVKKVNYDAIVWCVYLKSLYVSKNVKEIEIFGCTKLSKISVDKNNKTYTSVDGVLFNKKKTLLYVYPAAKKDTSYTIPNSVKTIEPFAFHRCNNLKTVTVSKNVKVVKLSTFYECKNLQNITFLHGVSKIEDSLPGCKSLKKLVIPASVKYIVRDLSDDEESKPRSFTIYAPSKSYAQSFAKKYKIPFKIKKS